MKASADDLLDDEFYEDLLADIKLVSLIITFFIIKF